MAGWGGGMRGGGLGRVAATVIVVTTAIVGVNLVADSVATANIWASTSGSCTRQASPVTLADAESNGWTCSTFDAANDVCQNGDTVRVKVGTYANQTLTGSNSRTSNCLFKPENDSGATYTFSGVLNLGGGSDANASDRLTISGITGAEVGSGTCPECRYMIFIEVGNDFVRIEDSHVGAVKVHGSQDIEVVGNDLGPCPARTSSTSSTSQSEVECSFNKVDHFGEQPQRILYEDNLMYDYDLTASCFSVANGGTNTAGQPDCHWRAWWCIACDGVTFRGNVIRDSKESPALANTGAPTLGTRNAVIENNYFGPGVKYGTGAGNFNDRDYGAEGGIEIGWCNTNVGVLAYDNVKVRFNSSYGGNGPWIDPAGEGSLCNDDELGSIEWYGNIGETPQCRTPVTYRYNVNEGGTCHATDVGSVTLSGLYSSYTTQPGRTSYNLSGATNSADNLVPTATLSGCPGTDRNGVTRPQSTNCDAGGSER
jgi:hypothetical protein